MGTYLYKYMPSSGGLFRKAVGVEEDFAGLAGFEEFEGVGETVEREAFVEKRLEIEAAGFEERGHLLPSLEHFASVDSLHDGAFENHIADQIERDRLAGNAEERGASALAEHLKTLADTGGIAAHFEEDVDAVAVGGGENWRDGIGGAGIENLVGAHLLSEGAAMRVHFGGENRGGAASARDSDGHESDGAAAGDGDGLAGDFSSEHGVDGVAERIENGGVMFRNGGIDFPDVARGDADKFGEAAVGIYADNFHVAAKMRLSGATGAAMAAVHMHLGADEIAGLERFDFGADFFDGPAEFVAEGHRRANARGGPFVPMVDMKVGAADGGGADADENVRRAKRRDGNGFELSALFGARLAQSFHLGVRLGCGRLQQASVEVFAKKGMVAYAALDLKKPPAPLSCNNIQCGRYAWPTSNTQNRSLRAGATVAVSTSLCFARPAHDVSGLGSYSTRLPVGTELRCHSRFHRLWHNADVCFLRGNIRTSQSRPVAKTGHQAEIKRRYLQNALALVLHAGAFFPF